MHVLPAPLGPVTMAVSAGSPFVVGLEDAREVVDSGVAMLNFSRDELSAENASIAGHLFLTD
jgi:hypothetical protein